ncbi:MAG: hypothetical protein OEY23_11960 [Acidimicrobiia bacterium]|nr:hypothetical protein [Acidimicrobiia bacterium]
MSDSPFVALTRVQAWRVLAYLTALERTVIAGSLNEEDLPMWAQMDEIILGLDGLSLTIDAVESALEMGFGSSPDDPDDPDGGGGGGSGDREPRRPNPGGGPPLAVEIPVPSEPAEARARTVLAGDA